MGLIALVLLRVPDCFPALRLCSAVQILWKKDWAAQHKKVSGPEAHFRSSRNSYQIILAPTWMYREPPEPTFGWHGTADRDAITL
jgi:hypothetical protein